MKISRIRVPYWSFTCQFELSLPSDMQLVERVELATSLFSVKLVILQRSTPQVYLRFVFQSAKCIENLISFKDRVPSHVCSSIVYQFACSHAISLLDAESTQGSTKVGEVSKAFHRPP